MSEQGEALFQNDQVLDLSEKLTSADLKPEIAVRGVSIGAGLWGKMQKRTKQTGKEYGLVVWSNKKSKSSDIVEGSEAMEDPETGEINSHGVDLPSSKLRWIFQNKIAYVHTHLPEAEDTIPSKRRFSRRDIETYINSGCPALIMLDGKGVHMLIRPGEKIRLDSKGIAKAAYEKISQNTQSSGEVRRSIADSIARFGIKYYFTPDFEPSPDGIVNFKDIRSI